jgi:hypothetical protein
MTNTKVLSFITVCEGKNFDYHKIFNKFWSIYTKNWSLNDSFGWQLRYNYVVYMSCDN